MNGDHWPPCSCHLRHPDLGPDTLPPLDLSRILRTDPSVPPDEIRLEVNGVVVQRVKIDALRSWTLPDGTVVEDEEINP